MSFVIFWIAFAIIVGVAANTRGRSGAGWFLLALVISPLIAGLLVLALPRVRHHPRKPSDKMLQSTNTAQATRRSVPSQMSPFEPDGVYSGIPYKVIEDGLIEALMPAGQVRFKNMDQFVAAATGGTFT